MSEDNEFLIELQDGFLEETRELLDLTENSFLQLEKTPNDLSIIENIFRLAHNIKGSAAAVNFIGLSTFAHKIENLLVALKQQNLKATSEVVDILLTSNDLLTKYIEALEQDKNSSIETSAMVDLIDLMLETSETSAKSEEKDFKESLVSQFQENEEVLDVKEENIVYDQVDKSKNLGEILLDEKLIKEEQLEEAVSLQNSKVGEILVKQGAIEENDLRKALDKQEKASNAKKPEEYIRLPLSKIENLLNSFGEQVILQSSLEHYRQDVTQYGDEINRTIMQLNKITYDLQQTAIGLRMVSMRNLFNKMQRIVRDTSKSLGKNINFVMEGEDTELDKTMVDEISSPLTHLIRNSVDHGIETPEQRLSKGKTAVGTVTMKASYRGRYFFLEVTDDGKGLDKDTILAKAKEKGLIGENESVEDSQILDFVFMSGFSTKKFATDISGRGVGMDAIKKSIETLRGNIDIDSKVDGGTNIVIKLPPTLAMFNGMVIDVSGQQYIIPNSEILDLHHISLNQTHRINDNELIVKINDDVIPLIDLSSQLGKESILKPGKKDVLVLLITKNNRLYGLMVDDVIGQHKIVYKNLGAEVANVPGIAGGTILGDGQVALILEITDIVNNYIGGGRANEYTRSEA
ncbi:MAG: chemotaxis protein CheA [Bacteriovoracia bacterium]